MITNLHYNIERRCHLKYSINPQIDGIEYALKFIDKNYVLINDHLKNEIENLKIPENKKENIHKLIKRIESKSSDIYDLLFKSISELTHIQQKL